MMTGATGLNDLVPICRHLPPASIDQLIGATRIIARSGGRMSPRKLAAALRSDDEQMIGVIDFLSRLGVVEAIGSEVALTDIGKRLASAAIPARQRVFAELAIRLPVMHEILDALADQSSRSLPRSRLLEGLGAQSCAMDADRVFDQVVAWGRYAGLFSYDASSGLVSLL